VEDDFFDKKTGKKRSLTDDGQKKFDANSLDKPDSNSTTTSTKLS